MKKMRSLFEGLDKVLATISAITLFIMMMWIFIDVAFRSLFNSPLQGTVELTGEYLMVILVYLMISNTHKFEGHVSVDVFQKKLSKTIKKFAKLITNLISAIFFAFISVLNFQVGLDYVEQHIKSTGILKYPLAPALFIISLGLAMITIRLLIECFTLFNADEDTHNPIEDETDEVIEKEEKIEIPV